MNYSVTCEEVSWKTHICWVFTVLWLRVHF